MTPLGWVTMGVICTVVWGGFIGLLLRAMKFEGQKPREDR